MVSKENCGFDSIEGIHRHEENQWEGMKRQGKQRNGLVRDFLSGIM